MRQHFDNLNTTKRQLEEKLRLVEAQQRTEKEKDDGFLAEQERKVNSLSQQTADLGKGLDERERSGGTD